MSRSLVGTVSELAERTGTRLAWLAPTVARLTLGVVFVQAGWGKLAALDKVTGYFTEIGLPAPHLQAILVGTVELGCGALLLPGLATRLAAVPLLVTMCIAIRTALWDQVNGLGSLVGLLEFAYVALLLYLATHGPGPLSLDALLASPRWVTRGEPSRGTRLT